MAMIPPITRLFLSSSRSTILLLLSLLNSPTLSLPSLLPSRHPHRHRLHISGSNDVEAYSFPASTFERKRSEERAASLVDTARSKEQKGEADYLSLSDEELLAQCKMDTFRASGPGGQHRNKTDSAVRLRHLPTGLVSQAAEDRSQHKNRQYALKRLRQAIALKVRRPVELEGYLPPPELVRILSLAKGLQQIGPQHQDFPKGVQHLMDLLWEVGGSVSDAAKQLGLSTGALNKVITSDKLLWQTINQLRASKGMKPLR